MAGDPLELATQGSSSLLSSVYLRKLNPQQGIFQTPLIQKMKLWLVEIIEVIKHI